VNPGFAIVAEFPLGTYRGHTATDDIDIMPSVARLHAALVCAAGSGPSAELIGDRLALSEAGKKALEWLEKHPPDGVVIPQSAECRTQGTAYRDIGLIRGSSTQKKGRPVGTSIAVNGPFAWVWDKNPPVETAETLAKLCADVSHLGMAESPVRLRVDEAVATHRRNDDAELVSGSGINIEIPEEGRVDELVVQHGKLFGDGPPTDRRDRCGSDEEEQSALPLRSRVGVARYQEMAPEGPPLPWSQVLVVPLDREVEADWRVQWAVKVHRALISLVAGDVPAMLTGVYPEGAPRPANHVAIHFLGAEAPSGVRGDAKGVLVVLLPSGAARSDVDAVRDALYRMKWLRGPGGRVVKQLGRPVMRDASLFWDPVPDGCERRWRTTPAAVPDRRPSRHYYKTESDQKPSGPCRGGSRCRSWSMSMDDAVKLSVGLAWRDELGYQPGSDAWKDDLIERVNGKDVSVDSLRMLTGDNLGRFVHKVHPSSVVRPYEALISLGSLAGPRSLMAIGQSRHLGGGLLVPVDAVAEEEVES